MDKNPHFCVRNVIATRRQPKQKPLPGVGGAAACRHKPIFSFYDSFLQGMIERFLSPSGRETPYAGILKPLP